MRQFILSLIIVCTLSGSTHACLWDRDTLQQERSAFPNMLDLITGKFLRHSEVYYKWRVKDRIKQLELNPEDLALMDDLAVAYDKLKKSEEAIEVANRALQIAPDRYETLANLGTFYIHSGQLKDGAAYIEKAIQINPDAHFGREQYQLLLVKYILSKTEEGIKPQLPLSDKKNTFPGETGEFANFIKESSQKESWDAEESAKLLKGIQGMMRFGNYDSPILLEVAGESLSELGHMRLATRAYLQASYVSNTDQAKAAYREKAVGAIRMQEDVELEDVESRFRKELHEAQEWYATLKEKEEKWCEPGSSYDPDQEFKKLYEKQQLESSKELPPKLSEAISKSNNKLAAIIFAFLSISVTGFAIYRNSSQKRSS